ncbi:MAG: hypothetical protein QXQ18_00525 [Candidatus Aenigmatarchaeota archaeon]
MAFIRKMGKAFGSFLFSTFLFIFFITISLAQFTEYENLKNSLLPILNQQISSQISSEQIKKLHEILVLSCKEKEVIEFQVSQYNITLECKDIISSKPNDLTTLIALKVFDSVYYKEYNCPFLKCLLRGDIEGFLVIFSVHGNNFSNSMIFYSIFGSIAGIILILISSESWSIRLRSLGWNIIFSITPLFLFFYFKDFLITRLLPLPEISLSSIIIQLIDKIFEPIINYLLLFTIFGSVLIAAGYLIRKKGEHRKQRKS